MNYKKDSEVNYCEQHSDFISNLATLNTNIPYLIDSIDNIKKMMEGVSVGIHNLQVDKSLLEKSIIDINIKLNEEIKHLYDDIDRHIITRNIKIDTEVSNLDKKMNTEVSNLNEKMDIKFGELCEKMDNYTKQENQKNIMSMKFKYSIYAIILSGIITFVTVILTNNLHL